jgi:nitrogen fixation protein FixH
MTDTTRKPLTGRRVFLWLAAFFLLVIIMNVVMAYLGNRSWTGLTTNQAYDEGLKYNTVLEEAKEQAALGWTVHFEPVSVTGRDGDRVTARIVVDISGKDGIVLDGLQVSARILRPTSEGYDQAVEFTAVDERRFQVETTFPLQGQWDVYMTAANSRGTYRIRHRIQLP